MSYTNEDLYWQQERLAHANRDMQLAQSAQLAAQHEELIAETRAAANQQARHNYSMWVQTPDGRFYEQWEAIANQIIAVGLNASRTMAAALHADAERVLTAEEFKTWKRGEPWTPESSGNFSAEVTRRFLKTSLWGIVPGFILALTIGFGGGGGTAGFWTFILVPPIVGAIFGYFRLRHLREVDRVNRAVMDRLGITHHCLVPWAARADWADNYLAVLMRITNEAFQMHPAQGSLPPLGLPELRPASDFQGDSSLARAIRYLEPGWHLAA